VIRQILREPELCALLQSVIEKATATDAGFIAVRYDGSWDGPPRLSVSGRCYDVAICRSVLAVREELARERAEEVSVVMLTDRDDRDLGSDVLARVAKARIIARDPWDSVKRLFNAGRLDPTLVGQDWLADALLDRAPTGGYPAAATGCLDEDTAWRALLDARLGIPDGRPTLAALLAWTARRDASTAWTELSDVIRGRFLERFEREVGAAGGLLASILRAGRIADALSIGLASRVLFAEGTAIDLNVQRAVARLESILGGAAIDVEAGRRLARSAEEIVRSIVDPKARAAVSTRTEMVLAEVKAEAEAWRSQVVPSGFDQRRARLAGLLEAYIDGSGAVAKVESAASEVLEHELSARDGVREPIEMAVRLARWIAVEERNAERSLSESAVRYVSDGAYADRARDAIRRGGAGPAPWAAAARRLLEVADQRRHLENRRFADLLVAAERQAEDFGVSLHRIERVLDQVIVPLARIAPVLLLVVDGMNLAVHDELADSMRREGYFERRRDGHPQRLAALTAFPTITEVCRASLLTGAITRGDDVAERQGFEEHAGLRAASTRAAGPKLFHKAGLRGANGLGLAEDVRAAIASPSVRVVGAVLNAIDDHLSKGDQSRMGWSVESITPLRSILDAAREAGRVVILTSDHGHILEHGQTELRGNDGGSRWRADDGICLEQEVRLEGTRVRCGFASSVVMPCTETLRYAARQNGYHGGCTQQEALVPISVWATASATDAIAGWIDTPPEKPLWWESTASEEIAPSPEEREFQAPPKGLLFDNRRVSESLADRLIRSPVFAQQKKLIARAAVSDEQIRAIVGTLVEHGGTLTRAALCAKIGVAEFRLGGLLAHVSRALNVDGYEVLHSGGDDTSIRLSEELLVTQFEL
jgi:hypothetical protein